jgi:AcrR family transcriptional regulator
MAVAEAKDQTRERIMQAARKRFSRYGYAKTTMAEVAGDCGMSPGNLYRFFPGKLDIAEAIAREEERDRLAELEAIAGAAGKSARQRIYDFFFSELHSTFRKFEDDPEGVEIARILAQGRPALNSERIAAERRLIGRMLADGTRAGEFAVSDPDYTAEMIHAATLKFRFPQRWTRAPLDTLEWELDGVLKLVMYGLVPRPGETPI